MNKNVLSLIKKFNGTVRDAGGIVNAFFDDAKKTRECAKEIEKLSGERVAIFGTQIQFQILRAKRG